MKIFKEKELRTLWPFYLDSILSPLLFFAPAFFIVFFAGLDLSFLQIGILMAMPAVTLLIFEIPTGAIADLYGRKFSVLIGYLLEGLAFLVLFFVRDYYLILGIFAFYGFAATLSSGSKEAWVIDLIKSKKKNFIHDFFVKTSFFDSSALIVSGILGAFLVKQYGVSIIFLFAFFSFIVSILILLFAEEYYIRKKIKIKESFKGIFKQSKKSINYSRKHPVLAYFLLAGFFIVLAGAFSEQISWVPFLQSLEFPDYAFGYLFSGLLAITAIAPFFAKLFLKKGKEVAFFIKMSLIGTGLFLLVYFANIWAVAILILFVSEFFWEIQTPVSQTFFHKFIPNKMRATVGSFKSMIYSVAAIISLPIAGWLVDLIGGRYVIMISGIVALPGILFYLKIKQK